MAVTALEKPDTISADETATRENASTTKAISYSRILNDELRLKAEVPLLLSPEADRGDPRREGCAQR